MPTIFEPLYDARFLSLMALFAVVLVGCDGEDPAAPEPEPQGPPEFVSVGTGDVHACGLATSGTVFCWGANESGQLGLGDFESRLVPTPVPLPEPAEALAVGFHTTCILVEGGRAYCWGQNGTGQVGSGSVGGVVSFPIEVEEAPPLVQLSVTFKTTCGLATDGDLWCWGGDTQGILGHASTEECVVEGKNALCAPDPVAVHPGYGFSDFAMGMGHVCGLSQQVAYCWGWNKNRQLGDDGDQRAERRDIGRIKGVWHFEELDGGAVQSCGLDDAGTGWCWGTGALGNEAVPAVDGTSWDPLEVQGPSFVSISSSAEVSILSQTCGLDESGGAWCWGAGSRGALGTTTLETECQWLKSEPPFPCSRTPVRVEGEHTFRDMEAGRNFTCAVDRGGRIWCWGANDSGQLGTGDTSDRPAPAPALHPEGS